VVKPEDNSFEPKDDSLKPEDNSFEPKDDRAKDYIDPYKSENGVFGVKKTKGGERLNNAAQIDLDMEREEYKDEEYFKDLQLSKKMAAEEGNVSAFTTAAAKQAELNNLLKKEEPSEIPFIINILNVDGETIKSIGGGTRKMLSVNADVSDA